jgi:serine/threonine-protein kinase
VKFGAAGIAHALVRASAGRSRGKELATAQRLLAEASRALGERGAFHGHDPSFDRMDLDAAVVFGPGGLELERVLVEARARGAARPPSVRAFVERGRRALGGPSEFLFGVSGFLAGALMVERATGAASVVAVADELAHTILSRALGDGGWTRDATLGFAHGRAGIFHTLLRWSAARGAEPPPWFDDQIERLHADIEREGRMGAPAWSTTDLQRTWCNGAAGLVLLWARVYERTRDPVHLRRAAKAARALEAKTKGWGGDLCCGLGGRAFALLAMDRVDPGHGWSERAAAMAGRAADAMLAKPGAWPNGLYHGYPGLLCLASELASPATKRHGMPFAEG